MHSGLPAFAESCCIRLRLWLTHCLRLICALPEAPMNILFLILQTTALMAAILLTGGSSAMEKIPFSPSTPPDLDPESADALMDLL